MMNNQSLARRVNRLGELLDEIAQLENEARELRKTLIDSGTTEYDTTRFHMVVYEAERTTLDKDAVVRALGGDWVRRHSTRTWFTACRVTPIKLKAAA